ncbi:MAG: glycerol kinase GlpK [Bacteriovoracaceae bacterium]|nr:glycerol kinase GlpK [Bacteriovoracaceae bacterium]
MGMILAIDQGTTGTTAVLINAETLEVAGKVNFEFPQIFPKPGWVEHNLNDIWNTVVKSIQEVLKENNVKSSDIITIGITNQRETVCAFDKDSNPLRNAIVWQDRRTGDFCKNLDPQLKNEITEKTGLPVDPYFSGTKINWMINNDKNIQTAMAEKNCFFGTIDTFLIHKLTGGKSFVTEASNASRTLLFDIKKGVWCDKLLDIFKIDKSTLATVKDSFSNFGETQGLDFLPDGISINGVLGDQQAALFGQAGIEKGMSKCTYGTGAFYLINTGDECIRSKHGLLSTIAYREQGKDFYALEGSSYIAGAAVQWLRDQLQFFPDSPDIEALAKKSSDEKMANILFLPFFTGLGSPYWVSEATAAITGLTRDTGRPEIARACLEGICLAINDLIESIELDSGLKVKELRVDGGAVVNNFLMQTQANFSRTKIIRPKVIETTAFGAACAAAIGKGIMTKDQLQKMWKEDHAFSPIDISYFDFKKVQWKKTIKKLYL